MSEQYEDEEVTRGRVLSNGQVLAFIAGFWLRRPWLLVASAAVGKQITWRGITYSMDGPNATRVLARPPAGAAGFSPQANETAPVAPQAVTGQVASGPSAPFPTSGSAGSNRRAA